MWVFDRWSPYSYQNNRNKYKDDEEKREFNLKECLWFCMTSLTPQVQSNITGPEHRGANARGEGGSNSSNMGKNLKLKQPADLTVRSTAISKFPVGINNLWTTASAG